jgi:hypothetical protein
MEASEILENNLKLLTILSYRINRNLSQLIQLINSPHRTCGEETKPDTASEGEFRRATAIYLFRQTQVEGRGKLLLTKVKKR